VWTLKDRILHLPKNTSYERKWYIWHTHYFWNWWWLDISMISFMYLISTVTLQPEIQKTGWGVVCVIGLWAGVESAKVHLSDMEILSLSGIVLCVTGLWASIESAARTLSRHGDPESEWQLLHWQEVFSRQLVTTDYLLTYLLTYQYLT